MARCLLSSSAIQPKRLLTTYSNQESRIVHPNRSPHRSLRDSITTTIYKSRPLKLTPSNTDKSSTAGMCYSKLACGCKGMTEVNCGCRMVIHEEQRVCHNCTQRQQRQMTAMAQQVGGPQASPPQNYQQLPASTPQQYQSQPTPATTTAQTSTTTATAVPALPYMVQTLKAKPSAARSLKQKPQRKTKQPTLESAKPCQVGTADACIACERCVWWNREVAPFQAELQAFADQHPEGFDELIAQAQRDAAAPQPWVDEDGTVWTPVRYLGRLPAEEQTRQAREQVARQKEWEMQMGSRSTWTVEMELVWWWWMLQHIHEDLPQQQGTEEDPVVFEE